MIHGKGSQEHEYPKQHVSTFTSYSQPDQHTKILAVQRQKHKMPTAL